MLLFAASGCTGTVGISDGGDALDASEVRGEDAASSDDAGADATADASVSPVDPMQPGHLAFGAATYATTQKAGTVTLSVERTLGSLGSVSVTYATTDGTAVAGTEYSTTKGALTWSDGDTAPKSISVPVVQLVSSPKDRSFVVTLSAVVGATLGTPASATVTIAKDPGLAIAARIATGANHTCAVNTTGGCRVLGRQ